MNHETHALYLYGFINTPFFLNSESPQQLFGVDPQYPVYIHHCANLQAIVSWVALTDFTGEKGEHHLQDVTWITPRVCHHAQIIDYFRARTSVYPISFGTLFSNLIALEHEMIQRKPEIAQMLQHITGCEEWALEATLNRQQAVEILLTEALQTGKYTLPENLGRRHLEEQKLRRTLQAGLNHWLSECGISLQNSLKNVTRDFRDRRLSADKVFHWAYLLPQENVAAFQAHITTLTARYEQYGFQFRITGPWAAYSFCQQNPS
jgi:Gas vesicle synthesis protein GvpL/GvpF